MTFSEMVTKVMENQAAAGYPFASKADAERKIKAVFAVTGEIMAAKESITIPGFGTFGTRVSAAREGRNVRTGETIQIPEKTVPKISFSKKLKDAVAE